MQREMRRGYAPRILHRHQLDRSCVCCSNAPETATYLSILLLEGRLVAVCTPLKVGISELSLAPASKAGSVRVVGSNKAPESTGRPARLCCGRTKGPAHSPASGLRRSLSTAHGALPGSRYGIGPPPAPDPHRDAPQFFSDQNAARRTGKFAGTGTPGGMRGACAPKDRGSAHWRW